MQRHAESPEKIALPTANVIENLLYAVNTIALSCELDQVERDRIQRWLAETMDVVGKGMVEPPREQHHPSERHVPTVDEADASADE